MSTAQSQPPPDFVDRKEEMKRIEEFMEKALKSEGHLLIVRGEPGVGKTRLVQEAAEQARSRGFTVGYGAGFSESIVPYQPWAEVLKGIDLHHILEELPPPKLLALYLLTSEGSVIAKVKLKDIDASTLRQVETVLRQTGAGSEKSKEHVVKEGNLNIHILESHRLLVLRDRKLGIGALVEGREDEAFLDDLRELIYTIQSKFSRALHINKPDVNSVASAKTLLRKLLEGGKYEGVDYARKTPELRRERLFNNVALGLTRKAALSPILIVLDDLQGTDPSSLALLQYVARNTRHSAVLLLGAHRTEAGAVRPHLSAVLKNIDQEGLSAELDLTGLAREHLRALANSFLGPHDLPEDFLDLLWTETEGNPLFVREVLDSLEEDGAIVLKADAKRLVRSLKELALPERVRDAIRARLDLLPKEDRELLDAAAACGNRFTASLVAKVAGEEESKVLNGLNNIARVHGLLQPAGYDFAFNHPTIQEVVHEALSREARQTYHREAAQWLELAGGPIEDVAEHYYMARDPRAVSRLEKAAEAAKQRCANEEAIRFYTEALEVAEMPQEQKSILVALANLYLMTGNFPSALQKSHHVLDLASDEREKARALLAIAEALKQMGDYNSALQTCKQALDIVEGQECLEEAQALYLTAVIHLEQGENPDHESGRLERSLRIWENHHDDRGLASSLTTLGLSSWLRGDLDAALAYHERALVIRERSRDLPGCDQTLAYIGVVHCWHGRYEEAWEYFRRSLEICEKIGDLYGKAQSWINFGVIHERRGNLKEALGALEKALDISIRAGIQWGVGVVLSWVGDVHCRMGDFQRAAEALNKSFEIHERIGSKAWQPRTYRCLAELHLAQGEFHEALSYAQKALDLATLLHLNWNVADAKRTMGCICREMGKWSDASENFSESIQLYKRMGMADWLGESHYEFGLMWKARGDCRNAAEHLRVAQHTFKELGLDRKAEYVGRVLADIGDSS